MRISVFHILLIILALNNAKWDQSDPFDEIRYSEGIDFSMSDDRMHLLHTYEKNEGDALNSIYYSTVNTQFQHSASPPVLVDDQHDPSYIKIKPFDGTAKNLLVVQNAKRAKGRAWCTPDTPQGCNDVFISESTNYGKEWSKPIQVPRDNMTDTVGRYAPELVQIKETGRQFIFYMMQIDYKTSAIGYVTRPKDSQLFMNEKIIFDNRNVSGYFIQAAYSIGVRGEYLIHLIWNERTSDSLYYSQTANYGVTWSEPKRLDGFWQSLINEPRIKLITNPDITRDVYFLYYKDEHVGYSIIESQNDGNSWSDPVSVPFSSKTTPKVVLCGHSDDDKYLFMLGNEKDESLKFGYYNPERKLFHNLLIPFTQGVNIESAFIQCREIPDNKYEVFVMGTDNKQPTVYFAKNITQF